MSHTLALSGFLATALACAALAALHAARGAPAGAARLFVAALSAQAVWAASAAAARDGLAPDVLSATTESLRLALWLAFLLTLLREATPASSAIGSEGHAGAGGARPAGATRLVVAGAALALLLDLIAPLNSGVLLLRTAGAVFGLFCVEQLWRAGTPRHRAGAARLAGAGLLMFGTDLVMCSDALMFGHLDPLLVDIRGWANALAVPLLASAAARQRDWRMALGVSRRLLFQSAALLTAGLFLMLMAAGGYWLRYAGPAPIDSAVTVLLFATAIALLALLGSRSARARLRVTVAKHFFGYRYDYREEWLRLTALLSAGPEDGEPQPLGLRALRALGGLADARCGALWLQDEAGAFVCTDNWRYAGATPSLPASHPLVGELSCTQWIIEVGAAGPTSAATPPLPAAIADARGAWLLVPLLLHEQLIGFALLGEPVAPTPLDWELRDALKTAAHQVASHLGEHRAVEALVQARQFESFNRRSAFVAHDLKNLVSQLSLLLRNAPRHRDNPAFQADMLDTVGHVHDRIQGLLQQLDDGSRPLEPPSAVPLAEAVDAAVRQRGGRGPQPTVSVEAAAQRALVIAHRDRLERVIGHLVKNASEAIDGQGSVSVRLSAEGELARLEVADTGRGMSERFIRERLFRPFHSTKPEGMGIGSFESREYIRELGGSLEVDSQEGRGTVFRVRLPLATLGAQG